MRGLCKRSGRCSMGCGGSSPCLDHDDVGGNVSQIRLFRSMLPNGEWGAWTEVSQGQHIVDCVNHPIPVVEFSELEDRMEGEVPSILEDKKLIEGLLIGILAYHEYKRKNK